MNVAYVFATPNAALILEKMIVPQLEEGRHGATVAGMFFFMDNNYLLVKGNPTGERLAALSKKTGMLLMGCDQCCYEREIADILDIDAAMPKWQLVRERRVPPASGIPPRGVCEVHGLFRKAVQGVPELLHVPVRGLMP